MVGIAVRTIPRSSSIESQFSDGLLIFILASGRIYTRSLQSRRIIPGPSAIVFDLALPGEIRSDAGSIGRMIEISEQDLDLIAIACPEFRVDEINQGSAGLTIIPLTRESLAHIDLMIGLGKKSADIQGRFTAGMTRVTVAQILMLLSPRLESSKPNTTVEEIAAYIEANYTEEFSLADLASRCGLNPSYFARAFKRSRGKTVFEYIHQIRVERACILLKRTDRPVIDIAGDVGYNNISFFNGCFKRIVGTSPVAYRRSAHR